MATINGSDSNDTLYGIDDLVFIGVGSYPHPSGDIIRTQIYEDRDDTINGLGGDDSIFATRGLESRDKLYGGAGDDFLFGGTGDDILDGGSGNDILIGGVKRDTLTGGDGGDLFYYHSASHSPQSSDRDNITDFNSAEGDKLHLWMIDADLVTPGNQSFTHGTYVQGLLTGTVIGGQNFQVNLVGAPPFDFATDIIG